MPPTGSGPTIAMNGGGCSDVSNGTHIAFFCVTSQMPVALAAPVAQSSLSLQPGCCLSKSLRQSVSCLLESHLEVSLSL